MKIATKTERDEIDEIHHFVVIGSILKVEPPEQIASIFANPDKFKRENEVLNPGFGPDGPFGRSVRFPDDYWRFLRDACREIESKTERLFGVTCWRLGVRGGPDRFETGMSHLCWSDEDEISQVDPLSQSHWRQLPHGTRIHLGEDPDFVTANQEDGEAIGQLFERSALPLGQELLQEAWRLSESNPRSALVIAYAAAETRAKELIVRLAPSTEWLVKNVPAPPLNRIVKDYFQELRPQFRAKQTGRPAPIPPKQVRRALQEVMEVRNRLVHGKGRDIELGKLPDWLRRIDDFVSLCDYYEGHHWALSRLSEDVRREFD